MQDQIENTFWELPIFISFLEKKLGKIVLRQYLTITAIVYMIMTMWWETGEGLISSSALGEVLSFKPPCLCFRKPSILDWKF